MLHPDINLRGKGSLRSEYRTEDGKDNGMYRIFMPEAECWMLDANSQYRAGRSKEDKHEKEEKENTFSYAL